MWNILKKNQKICTTYSSAIISSTNFTDIIWIWSFIQNLMHTQNYAFMLTKPRRVQYNRLIILCKAYYALIHLPKQYTIDNFSVSFCEWRSHQTCGVSAKVIWNRLDEIVRSCDQIPPPESYSRCIGSLSGRNCNQERKLSNWSDGLHNTQTHRQHET